jgi:uncharacterized repeat protein (TIGR01451 family)
LRGRLAIVLAGACLLLLLLAPSPALAATLVVTDDADSGPGTLRDQVAAAAPGDVVEIAVGVDPTLTSEIAIDKDLTIRGFAPAPNRVSTTLNFRVFNIGAASSPVVAIEDLQVSGGHPFGPPPAGKDGTDGGAILNDGALTIARSIISGVAGSGARSFCSDPDPVGGDGGRGGGIYTTGTLKVVDSTLTGSAGAGGSGCGTSGADGDGGAIAVAAGSAEILRSTISGGDTRPCCLTPNNSEPGIGGGIHVSGGDLTMVNSTVASNRGGDGAGVAVTSGSASLVATTVARNTSSTGVGNRRSGGLLHEGGVLTARNTLVAENTVVTGATTTDANCFGAITDGGHNLAFPAAGCPASFANDDPRLDWPGQEQNGGPTRTVRLRAGSGAVDRVPLAECTGPDGQPLTTDQRGPAFPRPSPPGGACDIGAFEQQPLPPTDLSLTKTVAPNPVAATQEVAYTFEVTNHGPNAAEVVEITDPLPEGYRWSPFGSDGCGERQGGVVVCDLRTVASGATETVFVTARTSARAGPSATNTATVSADNPDPDQSNNSDSATLDVFIPPVDLALEMSAEPATVAPGDALLYTLEASNETPGFLFAEDIVVTSDLPEGVTYHDGFSSHQCDGNDDVVTCNIGAQFSGNSDTREILVSVGPDAAASITNTATVSSPYPDPIPANDTASVTTEVIHPPSPDPPPGNPPASGGPAPTGDPQDEAKKKKKCAGKRGKAKRKCKRKRKPR